MKPEKSLHQQGEPQGEAQLVAAPKGALQITKFGIAQQRIQIGCRDARAILFGLIEIERHEIGILA